MGWFNEQIRERINSDQNIMEESLLQMAGVVLDKWNAERLGDERVTAREALDDILKYYHEKPVEIPEEVPVEEMPVEEIPVEEAPVEEVPVEEMPVEMPEEATARSR